MPLTKFDSTAQSNQPIKFIHISDLHIGWFFNHYLWKHFLQLAKDFKPNLVLVTGDLINTPFWYSLFKAKKHINQLAQKLIADEGSQDCAVIVIPGNHDKRISGLIPLDLKRTAPWINIALLCFLYFTWSTGYWTIDSPIWFMIKANFIFIILHFLLFGYFEWFFKYPGHPLRFIFQNQVVDIYPFDSASQHTWLHWTAEGKISPQELSGSMQEPIVHELSPLQELGADICLPKYKIALVHHHPVPIPYDDHYEDMMILCNSGAFLSELSKQKIRLILHGHKHHHSYSKIIVGADQLEEHKIGVLAAGTLSRGKRWREKYDYQFNLLELDDTQNMKITPYISQGGTFTPKDTFYTEEIQDTVEQLRRASLSECGMNCRSFRSITEVSENGNTRSRLEFRGFKIQASEKTTNTLPEKLFIKVGSGHIEGYRAEHLSENCPPVHYKKDQFERENTLQFQKGIVTFNRALSPNDDPIDFYTECYTFNTYAMTIQQFHYLNGKCTEPPVERDSVRTPVFPINKLEIFIQFPLGFKIFGIPGLLVKGNQNQRFYLLEQKYREKQTLFFNPDLGTVHVVVYDPPPNTIFEVEWHLTSSSPLQGRNVAPNLGETKALQKWLLGVRDPNNGQLRSPQWSIVQCRLKLADLWIRNRFKIPRSKNDPIEITLMVYDDMDQKLHIVGATFSEIGDLPKITLGYGNGIAGQAFKMNTAKIFIKGIAENTNTPYAYIPSDGNPDMSGIRDEALISIPLTHPENSSLIYGILNLSSTAPDSALLNLYNPEPSKEEEKEFQKAVWEISTFCFFFLHEVNGANP